MQILNEFKCPGCGETIQEIRKRRPHIRVTKESNKVVTKFKAIHTKIEYRIKPKSKQPHFKGDDKMKHETKSKYAGKKVIVDKLGIMVIEDWWDRIAGQSWMGMKGNPACLEYDVRRATISTPLDDEVLYGKTEDGLGHLVHITEVKEI